MRETKTNSHFTARTKSKATKLSVDNHNYHTPKPAGRAVAAVGSWWWGGGLLGGCGGGEAIIW